MRKSRLSWSKQERLIEHFVSGSTARCASCLVGVNKSTAAYYFHRLRALIAVHVEKDGQDVFGGEIEVDESYLVARAKASVDVVRAGKCLFLGFLSVVARFIPRLFLMPQAGH